MATPTPPPTSDKRQRLLKAAREVFTERSFESAAVSEIVKRAGVAQGTFYRYFTAKTDLIGALAEELEAEVAVAITRTVEIAKVIGEDRSLAHMLDPVIRAVLRTMEPYRKLLEMIPSEALLPAEGEGEGRRGLHLRRLVALIRRDQSRRRIEPWLDPVLTARLVWTVIDRVVRDSLREDGGERPLGESVGFLQRALGGVDQG